MLTVHTIYKGNFKKAAVKNKWTDHAVASIKMIARVWLDSKIAQSVLLFFKNDESGDLHSYMPIVSIIHQKNMPDVENLKGAKGNTNIIGIEPYSASLASDYSLLNDDNDIIVRIMAKNYWNGNEVFMLR